MKWVQLVGSLVTLGGLILIRDASNLRVAFGFLLGILGSQLYFVAIEEISRKRREEIEQLKRRARAAGINVDGRDP